MGWGWGVSACAVTSPRGRGPATCGRSGHAWLWGNPCLVRRTRLPEQRDAAARGRGRRGPRLVRSPAPRRPGQPPAPLGRRGQGAERCFFFFFFLAGEEWPRPGRSLGGSTGCGHTRPEPGSASPFPAHTWTRRSHSALRLSPGPPEQRPASKPLHPPSERRHGPRGHLPLRGPPASPSGEDLD